MTAACTPYRLRPRAVASVLALAASACLGPASVGQAVECRGSVESVTVRYEAPAPNPPGLIIERREACLPRPVRVTTDSHGARLAECTVVEWGPADARCDAARGRSALADATTGAPLVRNAPDGRECACLLAQVATENNAPASAARGWFYVDGAPAAEHGCAQTWRFTDDAAPLGPRTLEIACLAAFSACSP